MSEEALEKALNTMYVTKTRPRESMMLYSRSFADYSRNEAGREIREKNREKREKKIPRRASSRTQKATLQTAGRSLVGERKKKIEILPSYMNSTRLSRINQEVQLQLSGHNWRGFAAASIAAGYRPLDPYKPLITTEQGTVQHLRGTKGGMRHFTASTKPFQLE